MTINSTCSITIQLQEILLCCVSLLFLSLIQVVFSSCELGVFDVLLGAGRPLSAEEISQAVGASLDGTERLLAACTGLQLLKVHQDDRQGRQNNLNFHTYTDAPQFNFLLPLWSVLYSNTEEASVYLTRSSPLSLYQSTQYSSRTIYLCWHYLTDAVRSVRTSHPNFMVERAYGKC